MTAQIIKLSDRRDAKRRHAAKSAAVASGEFFVGASFLAAFAWLNAMDL